MIPFTPHLAHECLTNLNFKELNQWPQVNEKIIEVKNVNQTAPYKYPSGYVSTHPLFSRAIIIDKEEKIFVSGTASIEGHETKHHGNIELQYEQICKNLKSLIKNIMSFNIYYFKNIR